MSTSSIVRHAALAALAILTACGGKSGGASAGRSTAAGGGARDHIRIAMIAKSSNNPVFLAARTGAEAAARERSQKDGIHVEVEWLTPPQEDGQVQAERIAQAVNDGADAILISCSDAAKVNGAIDDAVARGVAVMTFDSDAPQSKRFAYYGVNDEDTGRQVMAELAKLTNGKANVAILAGNQNAPNLQKRVQGVKDEAAKSPGIKIVGVFNHIETPQDASAEVIRVDNAYPEVNAWAFVGGWPLYAPGLLGEVSPNRYRIVSVDGLPAELAYVDRGIAPVLLAQPVYQWGYVGVNTIVDKLHDKKDPPTILPMQLVRVTKDNLGQWARQLRAWGFADVDPKYLKM